MTTCPLPRPAPQALFDRLKDLFSANVMGGGIVVPESNEWYVVSNEYLLAEEYHSIAEQQWRERDPRYACCDNLVAMAAWDGFYPRPATYATAYVQITGVPGTVIPAYVALTVVAGSRFFDVAVGSIVPAVMPPEGRMILRMSARVAGAVLTTQELITTGTLATVTPGIDRTVTISGGQICDGKAAETCEQFRTRYIDRYKFQPRARYEDVKRLALDGWPCLTRICERHVDCGCCPEAGLIEMYPFFDGTFAHGIPPQNIIDDLNRWMFGSPQGQGKGQVDVNVYGRFHAPRAAVVDINVAGSSCSTTPRQQAIRDRITGMFQNLCPGARLCRRMFDASLVPILGASCDYTVTLTSSDIGAPSSNGNPCMTSTDLGHSDLIPACDVLPVIGSITITG